MASLARSAATEARLAADERKGIPNLEINFAPSSIQPVTKLELWASFAFNFL
jgi:hypothetical protein